MLLNIKFYMYGFDINHVQNIEAIVLLYECSLPTFIAHLPCEEYCSKYKACQNIKFAVQFSECLAKSSFFLPKFHTMISKYLYIHYVLQNISSFTELRV